jgi:hypothetical protein
MKPILAEKTAGSGRETGRLHSRDPFCNWERQGTVRRHTLMRPQAAHLNAVANCPFRRFRDTGRPGLYTTVEKSENAGSSQKQEATYTQPLH